uniref:Transcription and mRNA export factor ENY2 n=1 Tax=Seriola lalandi dorsalis TaxID=1841481 RepID=A0A3B4XF93_SERLL
MSKESRMRATINQKLTEMGEGERLKELLRAKLTECGWKDQMKAHCKEVIKDKGLEHVTVEDLMVEITPKGRGIPLTLFFFLFLTPPLFPLSSPVQIINRRKYIIPFSIREPRAGLPKLTQSNLR